MGNRGGSVPAMSVYEAQMQADPISREYMRNRKDVTGAHRQHQRNSLVARRMVSNWPGWVDSNWESIEARANNNMWSI
jgi:hypothetical protein